MKKKKNSLSDATTDAFLERAKSEVPYEKERERERERKDQAYEQTHLILLIAPFPLFFPS